MKRWCVALLCWLLGIVVLAFAPAAWAQEPPAAEKDAQAPPETKPSGLSKFVRVVRNEQKQPIALETAIVRFAAQQPGGVEVDLVAAVHLADRAYFERLNDRFEQYDAVLYELVASGEQRVPKLDRRASDNPLAMIQELLTGVLDLDSQIDHIDYTKNNFVHADLSPEEMAEKIRRRGDDGLTLLLSITADLLREQNLQALREAENAPTEQPAAQEEELDLFSMLLDPEAPVKLKRMMAEQFAALDRPGSGLGKTVDQILIADRNDAAIKALQKELAKGKKKVAIFFGAAHMPDFEKRLTDDFGLQRARETWIKAWDLRPRRGLRLFP
jgi:hypothetical protein